MSPCTHNMDTASEHQHSRMLHRHKHKNRHLKKWYTIIRNDHKQQNKTKQKINERNSIALCPWIYFCRFPLAFLSYSYRSPCPPSSSSTLDLLRRTQWHRKEKQKQECDGNTLTFLVFFFVFRYLPARSYCAHGAKKVSASCSCVYAPAVWNED